MPPSQQTSADQPLNGKTCVVTGATSPIGTALARRLASAVLHFTITAPGTTSEKATRAVELSVTKYCSVRSSLIADASVSWAVQLGA